ncbi:MAG: hypothetical protein M3362_20925 [Acidobacteriota bacterium]|nr:hypothetical protein [Acidobacteriota bacterium]
MRAKTTPAFYTRHAPLERLLALMLLALFTYTTTAEAVHLHGRLSLNQTASAETVVTGPDEDGTLLGDASSIADCLICQLHQNLSTTLFSPLPQVIAPQEQAAPSPAVAISYPSQTDTPQQGRAPPATSLV